MLIFWFQGYNHSTQAIFKNNTLHNLSLLTGNLCRPGAGPLSITGEANALGNRPADVAPLGIAEGDKVEVTSRWGSVHGSVHLTRRVLTGTVYMNMYGSALRVGQGKLVNLVCNPVYDMHSKQPEFKFSAVRIAKSVTGEQ